MYTASDEDKRLWEILSVKSMPKLKQTHAFILAAVNVVLPGLGTMIAACIAQPEIWSKTQLLCGLLQMFTAVFLIGWIWSIYWAFLFIMQAN